MPADVRVSGSYKDVSKISVKVGGSWKDVSKGSVKVSGAWKEFYSPAAAGAFDLLETVTVGSGGQATISFSNLNSTYGSTYQHLQLRVMLRSTRSDTDSIYYLQFNGDSTSGNYRAHFLRGTGSAVSSETVTSSYPNGIIIFGGLPAATNTSNLFGGGIIDILDPFETTKNTTTRALVGQSGSFSRVALESGVWLNTAALTSITLDDVFGNFVQYSRVSLYGLRSS
jgi:hypothetical protein